MKDNREVKPLTTSIKKIQIYYDCSEYCLFIGGPDMNTPSGEYVLDREAGRLYKISVDSMTKLLNDIAQELAEEKSILKVLKTGN